MESPLYSLAHIHKVIRTMLDGLEQAAGGVDWGNAEQVGGLHGHFGMVNQILREHLQHEDEIFFPALERTAGHIASDYRHDHESDKAALTGLGELLAQVSGATDKQAVGRRIYREAVALNANQSHHMDKEEQVVVPLMVEKVGLDEQWEMLREVYSRLPVEDFEQMIPGMMSILDQDEREAELRTEMRAMKPDAFQAVVSLAPRGMPPEDWQDLLKRIPELASHGA